MDIKQHIQNSISEILKNNYQIENLTLEVQQTKQILRRFYSGYFSFGEIGKKSPDVLGNELGEELKNKELSKTLMLVKVLNLSINNEAFVQNFKEIKSQFDVKKIKKKIKL